MTTATYPMLTLERAIRDAEAKGLDMLAFALRSRLAWLRDTALGRRTEGLSTG